MRDQCSMSWLHQPAGKKFEEELWTRWTCVLMVYWCIIIFPVRTAKFGHIAPILPPVVRHNQGPTHHASRRNGRLDGWSGWLLSLWAGKTTSPMKMVVKRMDFMTWDRNIVGYDGIYIYHLSLLLLTQCSKSLSHSIIMVGWYEFPDWIITIPNILGSIILKVSITQPSCIWYRSHIPMINPIQSLLLMIKFTILSSTKRGFEQ